ncbi:MAG: hypothetical protein NTZ01_07810 [Verrucomicrobia bacterium]|nr:hypothetical protein [Verrucomicrobiota bacterium]
MKIDPRQIPEEGIELTGSIPLSDYDIPIGGIRGWDKIEYRLHATRVGSEVTILGSLFSEFEIPCARCLDFIPWALEVNDFDHLCSVPDDTLLDLTPLIREDIILALPLAARCELDGAGKCPRSGRVFIPSDRDAFADKRRATVWRDLDQLTTEN